MIAVERFSLRRRVGRTCARDIATRQRLPNALTESDRRLEEYDCMRRHQLQGPAVWIEQPATVQSALKLRRSLH